MKINIIIISLIFLFSKNLFAKINDNIDPYCIGIEEANKLEKLKDFS